MYLQWDVLCNGEFLDQRKLLINDCDACSLGVGNASKRPAAAVDRNLSIKGTEWVNPRQYLYESRFTCPVLTHERVYLAGRERDADIIERLDAGK